MIKNRTTREVLKEKMSRQEILEKLSEYRFVPGHGPDYSNKTDEELLKYLHMFETMFEDVFEESEKE